MDHATGLYQQRCPTIVPAIITDGDILKATHAQFSRNLVTSDRTHHALKLSKCAPHDTRGGHWRVSATNKDENRCPATNQFMSVSAFGSNIRFPLSQQCLSFIQYHIPSCVLTNCFWDSRMCVSTSAFRFTCPVLVVYSLSGPA